MSDVVIEPATFEDLDELSVLLGELFSEESDFRPNRDKQLHALRLIFEQPNRGRVFVLRQDRTIVGMINLLFTISTAEGGFVLLLEDLVIHKNVSGKGLRLDAARACDCFRKAEELPPHHAPDGSAGAALAEFLQTPRLL